MTPSGFLRASPVMVGLLPAGLEGDRTGRERPAAGLVGGERLAQEFVDSWVTTEGAGASCSLEAEA